MNKSIQGYIDCCRIEGFGMSTSTVVSECTQCYNIRTNEVTRDIIKFYEKEEDARNEVTKVYAKTNMMDLTEV